MASFGRRRFSSKRVLLWAVLGSMVSLAGCRDEVLFSSSNALRITPRAIDFGVVWADGTQSERFFSVINDGRGSLEVTWRVLDGPFTVDGPAVLPPGETAVRVRFDSTTVGRFTRSVTVSAAETAPAVLALDGAARAIPPCEPSSTCVTSVFEVAQGRCVESALPDGQSCDAQTKCQENSTCQAGRCVGTELGCEDGNACTIDVCRADIGCEHLARPPCPGDGACMVGVCNPMTGCGQVPAEDGASCGSLQGCNAAEVCISGACLVRNPPDGFVCKEASPCQVEGRCAADVCVFQSPKTMLSPTWQYDTAATGDADAGIDAAELHDFVLEPQGLMTLGGFFRTPMLIRANGPQPISAPEGASRRCIVWNGKLVCADYPASPNGRVSAIDPATATTLWSFDVRQEKPEFNPLVTQIFMARLVVQGSDRLAALFEAYPKVQTGPGTASQCRSYFLVVMDARGRLVMGQKISDPLLDLCNHPHPYGVAADAQGNLYIAFSPTTTAHAPLKPGNPTMVVSYSRDGLFRWKVTDHTMTGGELAVARGLLYPENSSVILDASNGAPWVALPGDLGRAVVADTRLVLAPTPGGRALQGYEAGTIAQRWTHTLPANQTWHGDQVRLAKWQTSKGPRTVALAFAQDNLGIVPAWELRGVDVLTGQEAFSCPVALPSARTPPQLMEVGNGVLAVMDGALAEDGGPGCGKCDPPYAGSSALFRSFEVPYLSVAKEPWIGTFGGEGHDHREEVPVGPGPSN